MRVLVTGCYGFIGSQLVRRLLMSQKFQVYGIDRGENTSEVTDLRKQMVNLTSAAWKNPFALFTLNIADMNALMDAFKEIKPDMVIHLAAESGIRKSIISPEKTTESNLVGFANVLECCHIYGVKNFFYASSSSVYGHTFEGYDREDAATDQPVSYYAATKKANELMAHSYSKMYDMNCIGFRFFTVYGPYGRPDMAPWLFTNACLNDKIIKLFNRGNQYRSFTFIDDAIEMVCRLIDKQLTDPEACNVYNIGNPVSENLRDFVGIIENHVQKQATIVDLPPQTGDVWKTHCDVSKTEERIGEIQYTNLDDGLKQFCKWFCNAIVK
ncbi:hypothetical protein RsoM2USA_358 [Ralstonia phage RsoM2USA]|nr:hypothetical protein RsoM2USA_358 [Ralstonia phage RsoM2USA]